MSDLERRLRQLQKIATEAARKQTDWDLWEAEMREEEEE